jgi:ferritin
MMNPKVEQALNDQVHAEFYSFYLYLAVSSHFKTLHLDGFSHWMHVQAQEELIHAMKLVDYLNERGGAVRLQAIEAPPASWASPLEAVKAVLDHERHISQRINDLVDVAGKAKDHATTVVLHWYVNEQIEEEATADTLYHQVEMLKDSPHGILMLDRELAGRPAPTAAAEAAE